MLQDGVANVASGRLQEVDIQYEEETLPLVGGSSVPSISRNPVRNSLDLVGGSNAAANSQVRTRSSEINYIASQDRSPIRTLSEDRVHVSLRLGPLLDSEDDGSLNLPVAALKAKSSKAQLAKEKNTGRIKGAVSPGSRKRLLRSPVQGLQQQKKRRVTKIQNSPKRRQTKEAGTSAAGNKSSRSAATLPGTQPRTTIIPATRKKGADFRSVPSPLP